MSSEPANRPGPPHWACLGLGSNVDPEIHLVSALQKLRRALDVESVSIPWQSPAIGPDAPDYVNAALLVRTTLDRDELVARLKRVEVELGRDRKAANPSLVTIDIDLLAYDSVVQKADLWELAYRAVPAAELLPDLPCPTTAEPLSAASLRLAAGSRIWPRPEIFRAANPARASWAGAGDRSQPPHP